MDKRLRHLGLLRCFASAASHQSYSKAAEELAITQAAVSQQIRNLEQALDVKLFNRQGREMHLTQKGKILQSSVQEAFELVLNGFNRIQVEPEEGVLSITTNMSFASLWLAPRLWSFSKVHPDITIKIIVSEKIEDLRHSDIDVAIRCTNSVFPGLVNELLFYDPVFPVCSPLLVEKSGLKHPSDIGCCQLIEIAGRGRYSWQQWFDVAGVELPSTPLSRLEVVTSEMAKNVVLAGDGIALLSNSLVQDWLKSGQLVKPFSAQIEPGLKVSLLYDESSPRLRRIQLFRKWLLSELKADNLYSDAIQNALT